MQPDEPVTGHNVDQNRTCILTMQAARPGGVPTLVDWWYRFLSGWGQQAQVLYAAFEERDVSRWARLKLTIKHWRVHERLEHPNPTIAHAPLPLPLWLFYVMPQWLFGPVFNSFDQFVVAAGPCLHALPLALRGKPYLLWMATLYADELRGKAFIGDSWAAAILESPFWKLIEWQERFVLRRATHILSISPYTHRRILEQFPQLAGKVDTVLVPVEEQRFKPSAHGGYEHSERYLLNASRINDPRKNIPLLFEAFAQVREQFPDLKLVLVGDDPGSDILEHCEREGLHDSVIFKGKVPPDDLPRLYQQADLFVISSTQEGLGIVMLEAMACGTPVVATDCGGPEGIVVNGVTGHIVPNNDPEALAEAITALLSNPEHLKQLGRGCRQFVEQSCTPRIVEEKLYKHFVRVYPDSEAARRRLFPVEDATAAHPAKIPGWKHWLALGWGMLVLVIYLQHQWAIHGASVQSRIITPLLEALR